MESPLKAHLRQAAPLLSVGIMSADLMHLAEAEHTLEACGAALLHFDIMDGAFCPLLTAGPFFVRGIVSRLYKDVHLMVNDPVALIPEFAKAGADIITVHAESGRYVHQALRMIAELKNANDQNRGILRGIALNPGTPLDVLDPLLDEADIVCLLAVNPGYPGSFIRSTLRRFEEVRRIVAGRSDRPLLCIDGGITAETVAEAASVNPDLIVSGSAVFKNGAAAANFTQFTSVMKQGK